MGDQMVARIMADRIHALGHEAYMDLNGIRGGDNWKQETEKLIENCDWFLALISPHYQTSKAVQWHLVQALALQRDILPVLIFETEHYLLENQQYVDLTTNVADGVQELLHRLADQGEQERVEELAQHAQALAQNIEGDLKARAAHVDDEARIFIAYSRKQRDMAKDLYELLNRLGKAVFWDAKIHAGATWRQTIQKALDDCTHLIVLWTQDAAQSDEVEREVSYALSEGKVIIPLLSEDIPRLPYHLHGFHYVVLQADMQAIEADIIMAIENIANDDIWQ